ncbi:hypothetical protein LT85_2919 [Collimonas arenae]|uniref:DUF4123 domain-containing protein n=1 Tax=Collimonas arenae TaxID=279058 RepID=A0A0A1FGP6_9BURK|nr:DUF4123 domain-containing protein [Collimonas arenae]AIY42077.1 hypothetical protein LT85_2919 [Collimonas arenae]
MTAYYAQNLTNLKNVSTALLVQIEERPDLNWSLLIDRAFDYGQDGGPQITGTNCYDGEDTTELKGVAPWLLTFYTPGQSVTAAKQLFYRWLSHCSGRPMVSIVASKETAQQIAGEWKNLHFVEASDGQKLLLRFSDTRVLVNLPKLLTNEQWATLTSPLDLWLTIDREGELIACPFLPTQSIKSKAPFELSDGQIAAFTNAAESDAMIDYLAENMRDIIPHDISPAQLYAIIADTLALAMQYGVVMWPDKFSLICAACLTLGECNRDPSLGALLKERGWNPGALGEALEAAGVI